MGLFNSSKETKEEKQARKELEMMEKYGLQSLSDQKDIDSVRKIVSELTGTGVMEFGIAFGAGGERDLLRMQMNFQRAILEQNFILIRQLDRISQKLDK